MDLITTYLFTVLAAYVAQQGAQWITLFSWNRVLKAAVWPLIILRPLFASPQAKALEREYRHKVAHQEL